MEKITITGSVRDGDPDNSRNTCHGSGEKAAPTTVTNCEASGFWTEVLSLGFEDTAWMDKINSVTVNEIQYTKGTINSFGSDTNLWEIGNATGTFGSYKALKIASPGTYPMTIAVTADGYEDVTF